MESNKITDVRIDHDILFSEYDLTYVQHWREKIPYKILGIYMRRSCGGRTHLKVVVEGDLSPLDQLLIRAIMHDDTRRLRGDLERYALDSPVFGLLFDEKYHSGTRETTKAGEWIKI